MDYITDLHEKLTLKSGTNCDFSCVLTANSKFLGTNHGTNFDFSWVLPANSKFLGTNHGTNFDERAVSDRLPAL